MNELLIAIIPSIVSLAGIIITGVITNSIVRYRVSELEKQVAKHNSLIERMYIVETEVKDLKETLK